MDLEVQMKQQKIDEIIDKGKMIFCVDIDGTLCEINMPNGDLTKAEIHRDYGMDLINRMRDKYSKGHYIILYTGRPERLREDTEEWLHSNHIPYHELCMGKPKCHIYIDDMTIHPKIYLQDPDKYDEFFEETSNAINEAIRNGDHPSGDEE
jgi:uncharacterized HAD superfamily protein